MKNQIEINWIRIKKAILQKNKNLTSDEVEEVFAKFRAIHHMLGEYSLGRTTVTALCTHMLRHKGVIKCLVPVCPDYSHENGLYTLNNVSGGISMIAQKHIDFLKGIHEHIQIEAHFLYADYETEDVYLRNKVDITKEDFVERIHQSKEVCTSIVSNMGWTASLMTDHIPDIQEKESVHIELIRSEEKYKRKIEYDTINKNDLFNRINPDFTWDDKILRTLKYSAQYYVMGLFCLEKDHVVCNHTTANLSWYVQLGAGILHNPVAIY